jgi:hypothetical protein
VLTVRTIPVLRSKRKTLPLTKATVEPSALSAASEVGEEAVVTGEPSAWLTRVVFPVTRSKTNASFPL